MHLPRLGTRFHPEFPLRPAFLLRHSVLLRKYHVLLLPETSPRLTVHDRKGRKTPTDKGANTCSYFKMKIPMSSTFHVQKTAPKTDYNTAPPIRPPRGRPVHPQI